MDDLTFQVLEEFADAARSSGDLGLAVEVTLLERSLFRQVQHAARQEVRRQLRPDRVAAAHEKYRRTHAAELRERGRQQWQQLKQDPAKFRALQDKKNARRRLRRRLAREEQHGRQ